MDEKEEKELTPREMVGLGKLIAEAIQRAGPYPVPGIKIVTKIVYQELREAGYNETQLITVANTILGCVLEEITKRNLEKARKQNVLLSAMPEGPEWSADVLNILALFSCPRVCF